MYDRYIMNPIIKKIIDAPTSLYIVFYTKDCSYCNRAIRLLRRKHLRFKKYNIDGIRGGRTRLFTTLNTYARMIKFDSTHKTVPLIFIDGRFLGGYTELYHSIWD